MANINPQTALVPLSTRRARVRRTSCACSWRGKRELMRRVYVWSDYVAFPPTSSAISGAIDAADDALAVERGGGSMR